MKSDFRVINGYPPLISQELWEQCQKQKALNNHNGAGLKYSQKPFVLRGLITCGRTGRVCPCEDQLRRKYYSWVVCYTKTGQRRYIPEQDVLSAIETVLNRIKIPDSLINPLYEEIKNAEISEKQYCQQEIGKLRQEQEKLKAKLDNLFDLRLDGITPLMIAAYNSQLYIMSLLFTHGADLYVKASKMGFTVQDTANWSKNQATMDLYDEFEKIYLNKSMKYPTFS